MTSSQLEMTHVYNDLITNLHSKLLTKTIDSQWLWPESLLWSYRYFANALASKFLISFSLYKSLIVTGSYVGF